ncbi:hypothetical protein IV102_05085 [bacterium]|nr:hypothetical protein [bacterium]
MVTDELSPEYLAFSAMLDEQDNLDFAEGSEGALLLELRTTLQNTPELPLGVDFARTTAAQVERRFEAQSTLARTMVKVEPVLSARAFSSRSMPWVSLLALTSLGGLSTSWLALGLVGLTLLLAASGWTYASRQILAKLPGSDPWSRPNLNAPKLARLYYLIPVLATAVTGIVCGELVAALGRFSLSFQGNLASLKWLGLVAGSSTSILLLSALAPTWKALKEKSIGRPGWLLVGQLGCGLWLACGAHLLVALNELSKEVWPSTLWGCTFFLSLGVALLLSCLAPTPPTPGKLRAGLGHGLRSLLCGGVPILATLVIFYQLSLTRKIYDPSAYHELVGSTEAWVAEQKAIPSEQNGWSELKSYLLRPQSQTPEYLAVRARLKAGSTMFDYWVDKTSSDRVKAAADERDFLRELPRIESALKKPYFSYYSTQELNLQALLPDFITCRAVSRGLAALARQALQRHDGAQSLHYSLLNLQWSGKIRHGTLINLMIGVAQMSITLEPIQAWLGEEQGSPEQLQQLLAALEIADVPRTEFLEAMHRETYVCDRAFSTLLVSGKASDFQSLLGGKSLLARLVPKEYWESERKTYVNLQLSQLSSWRGLGRPAELNIEEMLPMSFAAREMVPNSGKAQAQFMCMLSRISALKIMTALELYRSAHGDYPDQLSRLVPEILPELPVDAMHPNLWPKKPTFEYLRSGQGYQLISQSPLYENIRFKNRQVYGVPGKYRLETLPQ